jgi:hypothetical protein
MKKHHKKAASINNESGYNYNIESFTIYVY